MPTTRITDVIDPEVLSDIIITKIKDVLFMLPGISAETNFPIPKYGTIWTIPYADILGNLETFIAGTPLTIQNMTQSIFRSVVIRKGGLYGIDKIVELAGFKNPMNYFSEQFTELLLKTLMETQISVLTGGIPTANISNQTGVSVTEALIQATKQKIGDATGRLKYIIMHSAIYATLENAGKITWQPRANIFPLLAGTQNKQLMIGQSDMVPTIAGLIIVQTDKCPYSTPDYSTFILGERVMGLFYQKQVEFETDKDISLFEKYIAPNFDYVMPLYGVDYTSADYAVAALETAGNYTLKWDQKLIRACKLICTP